MQRCEARPRRRATLALVHTLVAGTVLLAATNARAQFNTTVPAGTFVLDERVAFATAYGNWNDEGELGSLLEPIERYEPGSGKQGTITADPISRPALLINSLMYGITDSLSVVLVIPVLLYNKVDPRLSWVSGDYIPRLGRPYGEEDFW